MKKRLLLLPTLIMLMTCAWAQGPNGSGTYYKNADGKCGAALKTAMHNIIKITSNDVVSYSGLNEKYKLTDKRADGCLRDWYSNITNYTWNNPGGNNAEGAGWNKEHTVPQSWFSEATPMKSDIIHVVPTDCWVNGIRSSYVFAEVANITKYSANNYSILGSCKTPGYSGTVFEPNDEIKGDIARIYFYMATCYQDKCTTWKKGEAPKVFSNENQGLTNWVVDLMMAWSELDPIDDVEIARNNAIPGIQHNRNPYVDYPGLEHYIWGDKQDVEFSYDNYTAGEMANVARPTFSPDAGTYYNSVEVTLSCKTAGATIYYTLNGEDASEQSTLYEGPFTIDELGTYVVNAVAIKDGERSAQASATYTITEQPVGPGGDTPADCEIALNNTATSFNVSYSGVINKSNYEDLTLTQNGITVTYALGTGGQRYANGDHIRLYDGNLLTVSLSQGVLTEIEFVTKNTSKQLQASTGSVDGYKWTGSDSTVEFSVNSGSGNLQVSGLKIKIDGSSGPSDIDMVQTDTRLDGQRVIYDLSGRRVTNPTRGIYIVDGRKVVIK